MLYNQYFHYNPPREYDLGRDYWSNPSGMDNFSPVATSDNMRPKTGNELESNLESAEGQEYWNSLKQPTGMYEYHTCPFLFVFLCLILDARVVRRESGCVQFFWIVLSYEKHWRQQWRCRLGNFTIFIIIYMHTNIHTYIHTYMHE